MQKLPLEGTSSITYYFHLDQDDHAKEIRLQNWAGQSCYGTFWNDFGEGLKKKIKFLFEQMKDKKVLQNFDMEIWPFLLFLILV